MEKFYVRISKITFNTGNKKIVQQFPWLGMAPLHMIHTNSDNLRIVSILGWIPHCLNLCGGFLKWGYLCSSSILFGDFPWNKPTPYGWISRPPFAGVRGCVDDSLLPCEQQPRRSSKTSTVWWAWYKLVVATGIFVWNKFVLQYNVYTHTSVLHLEMRRYDLWFGYSLLHHFPQIP